MLNKVILIGNLGDDPEVRHLESGAVVAKFSLATNEKYKDKNGETQSITEWHDVIAWRGLAEIAEKYLKKGKQIYVEGKLTTRKWQDQNGQTRRTTEVVASTFQMLGGRDGGGSNNFPSEINEPINSKPLPASTAVPLSSPNPNANQSTPAQSDSSLADDLPF